MVRKPRSRHLPFWLIVALALSGCVRLIAPPRQPISPESQRWLALLDAQRRAFSDLRGLADILVKEGGRQRQLSGVLLAKAPASLRFEALSPLGQPLLIVTIDGGTVTAYNATTNEARVGPATEDTAARVLSLPLDPADLVAALAGVAAPPSDLRVAEVLPADEDGPSLELTGADRRVRVWMDGDTGLVHRLTITGGRYAATLIYHRDPEGHLQGFDLRTNPAYASGSLHYRSLVVDGGVDPARFRLALPRGVTIAPLD